MATALCASILTSLAAGLGCGPRRAALVGLAYGLGTPAYVFATLNYGHQSTACLQFVAFAAIARSDPMRRWAFLAGFCSSYATVIELQSGPVSAILGFYLIGRVLAGQVRPAKCLAWFAAGVVGPVLILVAYNLAAFGKPFDAGYFHLIAEQFRKVHSESNPLGLERWNLSLIPKLLYSEFRGLLIYAPILWLAGPGWVVLGFRRRWNFLTVSMAVCGAVFLVNLSYPAWTGGWSTGPRFLVPMLPFAMLPVAALLALPRRWLVGVAAVLAVAGWVEMSLFQGVGGRIPDFDEPAYRQPLREVVWPIWAGDRLPMWKEARRFDRTLADPLLKARADRLPAFWRGLQFAPFFGVQIGLAALLFWALRKSTGADPP